MYLHVNYLQLVAEDLFVLSPDNFGATNIVLGVVFPNFCFVIFLTLCSGNLYVVPMYLRDVARTVTEIGPIEYGTIRIEKGFSFLKLSPYISSMLYLPCFQDQVSFVQEKV